MNRQEQARRDRANWAALLTLPIRAYQLLVSPLLPPSCRFLPTCSDYAQQAIRRHGVRRGLVLAVCRLARCHPWGGSGWDPVPGLAAFDRRGGRPG